jgi:glutamyl-tRNA reductase
LSASFVLLSTCNRSELYFYSESLSDTHQEILQLIHRELPEHFEQKLYTFFGMDCFLHLAKVTAGLDSAIVAETEIQGQVRAAYELAAQNQKLPKELHFLFQKSLKAAKEARACYQDTKQLPDLEHVLLYTAQGHFGKKLPPVLFIGASEINIKIARFFKQRALTSLSFCNRRPVSFPDLETAYIPWDGLKEAWQQHSWIIVATKCPHFLPLHTTKASLLIDLSVPRNIDPQLQGPETQLLNIDDLQELLDSRIKALDEKIDSAKQMIHANVRNSCRAYNLNKTPKILPICI